MEQRFLLDLVDYSWTMGLNFEGLVLSQPNLTKAKGRTPSSPPDPHQNLLTRSKFALGDGRSKRGLVFGDRYLLINGKLGQMVMMFGEFNIIIGLFFSTSNLVSVFLFNL
jgi:hypothetical protein